MTTEINKPDTRGIKHIFDAFGYSLKGLKAAVTYEEAFRLELLAVVIMLPLAIWLGSSAVEYAMLIGSLLLVLIIELINSALEAVVDRIGVEHHELSGRAKDIGSAAVMLTLINAAVIWGFILYDRLCG
jgi:diacylglycerol kinase (ATP)